MNDAASMPVFFYGSYMHAAVLAEHGVALAPLTSALLLDYDLHFQPLVTLAPAPGRWVWGGLGQATPDELRRLYDDPIVQDYGPVPVQVRTLTGQRMQAQTYLAPARAPVAPSPDYVQRLVAAARALGLPDVYVERLADLG